MEEATMGTQQAARELGVDSATIRAWCRQGLLGVTYKALGKNRMGWRIPITAVEALKVRGTRHALPQPVSA